MDDDLNHTTISATSKPRQPGSVRRSRMRVAGVTILCITLTAATLAACGSSDTSSSTTVKTSTTYSSDKQELCQARDQLKTSIKGLTNPALLTQGTSGITDAVGQVKTSFANVKTAAKQDYQPQIQALQTSIDDLESATGKLSSGNAIQNMPAVGTAIAGVGASATDLLTELKTTCG